MGIVSPPAMSADMRGIEALRSSAARDPKAALKEAAKQFEAIFMQELMKSMRQATLSSGMLDNAGTKMGTDMLDTQFAQQMTGLPGGLSDVIARQLERQMGGTPAPSALQAPAAALVLPRGAAAEPAAAGSRAAQFVQDHSESARAAEAASGIPASFMVAQAAHESGWGKREILNADGSTSHNLFGIKAGPGWKGAVAEITTTEYVNGEPQKVVAKFRAYNSYAESFNDYARLMRDSPRYSQVVANASTPQGFSEGLQRAGYATDPAYAEKLTRVINTTLRLQRAMS
ncbi:MAG: flagellar assembly peptidoglycan hydrolase FlgJ [Rhizobacter sp.]|nr:flagellar assembly peptidoglycan hydrolase FlgJ [Rhizobacter sp.]